jgi:hypothetical protein
MTQEDQAELVIRTVQESEALEARMNAEAAAKAHGLIQDYLGPDHKVIDMQRFYLALVSALKAAREQGQADASGPLGGVSNFNKG